MKASLVIGAPQFKASQKILVVIGAIAIPIVCAYVKIEDIILTIAKVNVAERVTSLFSL